MTVTERERTTVLLLKPPLLTVTAIVAEPDANAAVVRVRGSVHFPYTTLFRSLGTMVGSLEKAVTVSVWFSVGAPELIPERLTVCDPAFSSMAKLLIGSRVGR